MTKSQNTKNEQHFIKQNEKSFIQKDLSLTELWQKGELETNKYYYVRDISYILPAKLGQYDNQFYFSGNEVGYGYEENTELEVFAPVPTFEEWKASEKYNKHLEEVIKVYERKDKQATETSIAYNELAEENDKLKTENKWYSEQLNESVKEIAQLKELIEKDKKVFAESRIYPAHLITEDFPVKYDIDKYKEAIELIKKGLQETIDGYRMTPISRAELLLKELNEVLK